MLKGLQIFCIAGFGKSAQKYGPGFQFLTHGAGVW